MLDTVAIFDVDVMRGMSFAVVPVKTSQPEKMVDELKALFASDKEGPLKGRVRFIPNTRLNAILVVTSQSSYLPRAQEWIRRLDAKANGAERQLHIYQVQNRAATELAGVLQSMFSNEMKIVRPTQNVSPRSKQVGLMGGAASTAGAGVTAPDSDPSPNAAARAAAAGSGDLQGLARALNNEPDMASNAPDAAPSTTGSVGEPPLKIVADETKNSLLIMGNDRDYQRVLRVISRLGCSGEPGLDRSRNRRSHAHGRSSIRRTVAAFERGDAHSDLFQSCHRGRRGRFPWFQLCHQCCQRGGNA